MITPNLGPMTSLSTSEPRQAMVTEQMLRSYLIPLFEEGNPESQQQQEISSLAEPDEIHEEVKQEIQAAIDNRLKELEILRPP